MNEHWPYWLYYLVVGASTSSAGGFPGPLLGDAVDVVASPCGRVRVLLPQVHGLKRLLTWGWTRRLWLRHTFLWLRFSVKRGVLPGQLGQIGLCWDLVGRKRKSGKAGKVETDMEDKEIRLDHKSKKNTTSMMLNKTYRMRLVIFYNFLHIP